ncbi:peptidase S28 [Ophiocordyceps camponoti-floridani]|uniref:Peptidase S28 n=1 Tax=Ophiocordyceps camponoti-floridani TaxID=2030778 RepID=A0A8H4VB03_9HYPO|nr:peptidase S28 [Ophiocordyceps camponoti-floridani]
MAAKNRRPCQEKGLCKVYHVSQPINHTDAFGPSFQQRYVVERYTYQRKGPIILQIITGNAQAETAKSVITEYAHKMKGIAVGLEHRYFDGSHPKIGKEDAKFFPLDHLTLDNVLSDAVNLIRQIRTTIPGAGFSPVIAYGAGYAGFLALALRQNYPGIFLGAVAMAAPTRSLTYNPNSTDEEQYLYRDAVARLLIRRDPEAAENIGKTFDFLEGQFRLGRQDPMKRLQVKLNLCTTPHFNDTDHLKALQEFYANAIIETTVTSYVQSEQVSSIPKMNELTKAASFNAYGENLLDIYSGFLQWLGKTWLRRHERKCVDWENKATTLPLENMFDPTSYIRCTYFPLCLANSKQGGLFPARTNGCLDMRQKCQDIFHGKAVQVPKEDFLEEYKLSQDHLAKSSRIIFSIDRSDPMTALVGADPPTDARWNSCNVSRRVEFDFVGRINAAGRYIKLKGDEMHKWRMGEIAIMQNWMSICDKPELIFSSDGSERNDTGLPKV